MAGFKSVEIVKAPFEELTLDGQTFELQRVEGDEDDNAYAVFGRVERVMGTKIWRGQPVHVAIYSKFSDEHYNFPKKEEIETNPHLYILERQ